MIAPSQLYPRPTPGGPQWDTLTIVALMESALNGMAEQFWNGASFSDLPDRVQIQILSAMKNEAADRLVVIREKRRGKRP